MSDTVIGALLALAGVALTGLVGLWAQGQNNRHQERMLRVQLHEAKKREILHEVNVGITACYEALSAGRRPTFTKSWEAAANLVFFYCAPETNGAINRLALMPPVGVVPRVTAETVEAAYQEVQQAIKRELNPE